MRVGFNPNKDKNLVRSDYYHKIIIPVYIPNFEGYFKDSFRIFKICLNEKNESECYDSTRTLSSKTKETIINSLNTLKPNYCHSNFNYELFFFCPYSSLFKVFLYQIIKSLCLIDKHTPLSKNLFIT